MSRIDELKCWPGYRRVRGKVPGSKGSCKRMGESIYDRIGDLLVEDLRKWVKERWVDIGAPKKGGGFKPCGRSKGEKRKGYPKCVPAAKAARMSKGQRRSAVKRKRAAGNPGGKPTMVSTFKEGIGSALLGGAAQAVGGMLAKKVVDKFRNLKKTKANNGTTTDNNGNNNETQR